MIATSELSNTQGKLTSLIRVIAIQILIQYLHSAVLVDPVTGFGSLIENSLHPSFYKKVGDVLPTGDLSFSSLSPLPG